MEQTAYPETDLQDYVQKITLKKSNYATAAAQLQLKFLCAAIQ